VEAIDAVGEFAEPPLCAEIEIEVATGIELGGYLVKAVGGGGFLTGRGGGGGSGGFWRGGFDFTATAEGEEAESERENYAFPEGDERDHKG